MCQQLWRRRYRRHIRATCTTLLIASLLALLIALAPAARHIPSAEGAPLALQQATPAPTSTVRPIVLPTPQPQRDLLPLIGEVIDATLLATGWLWLLCGTGVLIGTAALLAQLTISEERRRRFDLIEDDDWQEHWDNEQWGGAKWAGGEGDETDEELVVVPTLFQPPDARQDEASDGPHSGTGGASSNDDFWPPSLP